MTEHLGYETLIDYMHAGLTPEQDARVYEHLESCTPCRHEYDSELALTDSLRMYAAQDAREMPASVKAEIWARVRDARPSKIARISDWFRPAIAIPMAAAIALAAYFGTAYIGPRAPAPIDAAYFLQDHASLTSTVPFSDRSNPDAADFQTSNAPTAVDAVAVSTTASYMADATP